MIAVVAAALVVGVLAGDAPASASRGDHARGPARRYGVGVRVLALEDTTRPTPADPEGQTPVAGAPTRALPTLLYYPVRRATGPAPSSSAASGGVAEVAAVPDATPARGKFPVVLFSHGSPGGPRDYATILERWASEGYVVVAPTYPVSSGAGPDPVTDTDQRDQVRDARFVLDRVLALNRVDAARGGLAGLLDRTRIAVAGHSLGGFTTLALVSDCCRDPRVDVAVVLAGVARIRAGPHIEHPSSPLLLVHSPLDVAVPIRDSELAFARARRPKYLLEVRLPIAGIAAHILPFFEGGGAVSARVARVVDDFLAAQTRRDPVARRRFLAAARGSEHLRLHAAS